MTAFTFAIALTPRANARDWGLIEALLDLTLGSVRAQTDPDWRALIAVHERPRLAAPDPRVEFVEVPWRVEPPGPYNDDSGRKKHLLSDLVRDRGGGHLMVLDADDWVDRSLVAAARAAIGAEHVGGLIEEGLAVGLRALRAAPLPHPELEGLPFHRFCGSCGIALIRPGAGSEIRRDPFAVLRSHHRWVEAAAEHGEGLARLQRPRRRGRARPRRGNGGALRAGFGGRAGRLSAGRRPHRLSGSGPSLFTSSITA